MKKNILSLSLLSFILIGMFSTTTVAITYNFALTKGTETSEVMSYNEKEWGNIF